jgi:hypothetical protein
MSDQPKVPGIDYTIVINANPDQTAEALVRSMVATIFMSFRNRWLTQHGPETLTEEWILKLGKEEMETYLAVIPETSPFHGALVSSMETVLPKFARIVAANAAKAKDNPF